MSSSSINCAGCNRPPSNSNGSNPSGTVAGSESPSATHHVHLLRQLVPKRLEATLAHELDRSLDSRAPTPTSRRRAVENAVLLLHCRHPNGAGS